MMHPVALSSTSANLTDTSPAKNFNFDLEALRGLAAIIVIWHHIIIHNYWLDPRYIPTGIFSFSAPGHLSVLVFFVLSGYVIGISHLNPLGKDTITLYLKKRFVRIYPIYFVSMLFAIVVASRHYTTEVMFGNLLMMQNLLVPVIVENNPAWSLNYEILFYLLFIPLSIFRANFLITTVIILVAGGFIYLGGYVLWSTYAIGFGFWLCGVVIARNFRRPVNASYSLMVSMMFLLVSLEKFNVITTVFYKLVSMMGQIPEGMVRFSDLSYLPYCILMVLVFASKDFVFKKYITFFLLAVPAYTLLYILRTPSAIHEPTLLIPSLCYMLALVFYFLQEPLEIFCKKIIAKVSAFGGISYGLYIIHFPIIALFARSTWFSGSAVTFVIRTVLYFILCIIAAYILEKKFQPVIKSYFK